MKYLSIICFVLLFTTFCVCQAKKIDDDDDGEKKFYVLSKKCYDKIFIEKKLDIECLKKTLSEIISYSIVTLSFILKVPQIMKIIQKAKVTGLSFDSIYFELFVYSFSIAYNFHKGNPLKLYAENIVILFQTIIIVMLYKFYEKKFSLTQFYFKLFMFVVINIFFFTNLCPNYVFDIAIVINILLICSARFPQIYHNMRNKDTGQLSFITVFLSFAGAAARCFTVVVSSTDVMLMLLNVISVVLNGTLVYQILKYRHTSRPKTD